MNTQHATVPNRGVCVWLTGLSGAGKSTTAKAFLDAVAARGRCATLLDGDDVRAAISKGLGYSRIDRDTNVLRVASLALERVTSGELVVCALISPYRAARNKARELIGPDSFIEVFIDAPLHVCEARDVKGLYARARRGEVTGLTGVDAPYEAPLAPDLVLKTAHTTVSESIGRLMTVLEQRGVLPATAQSAAAGA